MSCQGISVVMTLMVKVQYYSCPERVWKWYRQKPWQRSVGREPHWLCPGSWSSHGTRKLNKWNWIYSHRLLVSLINRQGCRRQLIIPSVFAAVFFLMISYHDVIEPGLLSEGKVCISCSSAGFVNFKKQNRELPYANSEGQAGGFILHQSLSRWMKSVMVLKLSLPEGEPCLRLSSDKGFVKV